MTIRVQMRLIVDTTVNYHDRLNGASVLLLRPRCKAIRVRTGSE